MSNVAQIAVLAGQEAARRSQLPIGFITSLPYCGDIWSPGNGSQWLVQGVLAPAADYPGAAATPGIGVIGTERASIMGPGAPTQFAHSPSTAGVAFTMHVGSNTSKTVNSGVTWSAVGGAASQVALGVSTSKACVIRAVSATEWGVLNMNSNGADSALSAATVNNAATAANLLNPCALAVSGLDMLAVRASSNTPTNAVLRSTDGGSVWNPINVNPTATAGWNATTPKMCVSPGGRWVLYDGTLTTAAYSDNVGTSWTAITIPVGSTGFSGMVWFPPENAFIALGRDGKLYKSATAATSSWTIWATCPSKVTTPAGWANVSAISTDGTRLLVASSNAGVVYVYTNATTLSVVRFAISGNPSAAGVIVPYPSLTGANWWFAQSADTNQLAYYSSTGQIHIPDYVGLPTTVSGSGSEWNGGHLYMKIKGA